MQLSHLPTTRTTPATRTTPICCSLDRMVFTVAGCWCGPGRYTIHTASSAGGRLPGKPNQPSGGGAAPATAGPTAAQSPSQDQVSISLSSSLCRPGFSVPLFLLRLIFPVPKFPCLAWREAPLQSYSRLQLGSVGKSGQSFV